jgi:hypothetical protein
MKNLKEFVAAIVKNGGATYNLAIGDTAHSGYMVSKKGFEMKFLPETKVRDAVIQFMEAYGFELCFEENYMGAWVDEGILYMDISNNFEKRSEAIREGYKNEQLAIYDVVAQESVYLPTAQETGTMTQQQSFINYQIYNL